MQNKSKPASRYESGGAVEGSSEPLKRVLIVDEDPALVRQITEAINYSGFRAVPARSGVEALNILQHDSDFVAAILAVAMSDIQGPELVRYMKGEKRLRHIPIVMMSSQGNPTLSANAFSAGAQVFLPKPFTPSQLLAMLHMLTAEGRTR